MTESVSHQATLVSLQVGLPETVQANNLGSSGKSWTTGIFKSPVDGPVWLGAKNLRGDGQADLVHHGGVHKAVCAIPLIIFHSGKRESGEHAVQAGAFGENFTITGLTERDVCIGDIWEIGDAQVQVSQPRQPCWKLARRWNLKDFALRVQQSGRTGWYFRVLEEGFVTSRVSMTLIERPHKEWTVAKANHVMHKDKANLAEAARLTCVPLLSPNWRESLRHRVERSTSLDDQTRLRGHE